ncbi:hypothetical protein BGZ88_003111 [Linnemannia elongata]|nr:hypothetical protein BGZ88_003111 [Linnemannia elongata]
MFFTFDTCMTDDRIGPSIPSFSAARTPLHDRGSGSSSPTLSPPHRPLFDVDSDENEREQDEVADGGAAINVLDDHEEVSGDKKAEADGRPSNNIFDGPVAATEAGDMSWDQLLPAYTFSLPLTKDWGPQVTEAYNKIKKMTSLNYKQIAEIALLSGVLHFNEKHAGFEAAEMSTITNEILHRFYTKDLQEKDLKRSVEAATLWGTWVQKWGLNSASTAGENRKAALDQDGQARQPDIVGRTEEGHEAYYGELKGMHPSTLSRNADTLRIAVFTKDSLDELLRVLEVDLPLISFQSVGPDVVFFLGAKITNTVVHTRISNLKMPTCLSELGLLDQTFFFRMFQIRSLVLITSTRLKQKRREPIGDNNPFPTLATPLRNVALGIQSKAKLVKRKGKQTMGLNEAKRSKETVEA